MLAAPDRSIATRLIQPMHQDWVPFQHQLMGRDFLVEHERAALFYSPGLGKSSCVLAAFRQLVEEGMARRMLVVAPLRVCQLVWRQEAEKWTQFRDLRFSLLHGKKKAEALKVDADIFLINPEGIQWLCNQFPMGQSLPFDTLCLDELTKWKNSQGVRFKALRKRINKIPRRWGLTGTPAANGYMDLFGQMLILDDGASLGRYITQYRDKYFIPDYTGYNFLLRNGARQEIQKRIAPYVLHMRSEDCVDLPEVTDHIHYVDLPGKAWKYYGRMRKEMLAELPEGNVEAANAGAVYSKLKQFANGAVYAPDEQDQTRRNTFHVHDEKVDELAELIEELGGEQLLVAYEFQHDLAAIRARLGSEIPHIGRGVSETQAREYVEAWNRGEISVLLAHPSSVGHGLNLQESGAHNVCWFSPIWNYEEYDQLIDRLKRSGNKAARIVNHLLIARGTIDEVVLQALKGKHVTQADFLSSLTTELNPQSAGDDADTHYEEDTDMAKLKGKKNPWGQAAEDEPKSAQAETAEETGEAQEEAPKKSRGWGKVTGSDEESSSQKEAVRSRLRGNHGDEEEPSGEVQSGEEQEEEPSSQPRMTGFSSRLKKAFQGIGENEEDGEGDESGKEEEQDSETEEAEPPKKKAPARKRSTAKKAVPAKDKDAEKGSEKPQESDSGKDAPSVESIDADKLADAVAARIDYDKLAGAIVRQGLANLLGR